MRKGSIKVHAPKYKIYQIAFCLDPNNSAGIDIEGDEIAHREGFLEIYKDERLVAVIREFRFVREVTEEKTNE